MSPEQLGRDLANVLMGDRYHPERRALLYATEKREDLLRDELVEILRAGPGTGSARRELPLTAEQVAAWNESLLQRGYFSDRSGLGDPKKRGRIDAAAASADGSLSHLVEVKAWSATDAVEQRRYSAQCKYNHSLSKAFEIDALKLRSVQPEERLERFIVTAMFTIHCDGLSRQQLLSKGLSYVGVNMKQNLDKAGIGSSMEYRRLGLEMLTEAFDGRFGRGTDFDASIAAVRAFSGDEAEFLGVGVSLDLVVARLGD